LYLFTPWRLVMVGIHAKAQVWTRCEGYTERWGRVVWHPLNQEVRRGNQHRDR
jgi:hypothetical protein